MDMTSIAVTGLLRIVLSIIMIGFAWWALQNIRWDIFLAKPSSPQGKLLVIFLSIIIGSLVANFFIDYFGWSNLIRYFF